MQYILLPPRCAQPMSNGTKNSPSVPESETKMLVGSRLHWVQKRIHMIAGESIRVLYDPFFIDVHEDLLSAHSTDAVRKVLSRHSRRAVKLREVKERKKNWSGLTCIC